VFEKYQKEQNAIMDAQMKGIQQYAEKYDSLDDASALSLMKAHLDRDRRMVTLRENLARRVPEGAAGEAGRPRDTDRFAASRSRTRSSSRRRSRWCSSAGPLS
jgi:hypothetical protein